MSRSFLGRYLRVVATVACAALVSCGGASDPAHFEAAFAVIDITPTDAEIAEGVNQGGYGFLGSRGLVTGVHDPLYSRTMAIGYGRREGLILTVIDAVGMGNLWIRELRERVAARTRLDPERIVIASTHSHSGPDFQGLWGSVPEGYRRRMLDAMVDAMSDAWEARVPARLEVASTTGDNRNRRGWGFTDDVMLALRAIDLEDESLLGSMVAFAAHPIVLGEDNRLLSRDFCGYLVDRIEAETGAPALYLNGAQGDASPVVPPGDYEDDFARAEAYGHLLADRALVAFEVTEAVQPEFYASYRIFDLDVTNVLFQSLGPAGILEYEFGEFGLSVTTQVAYFRLGREVQLVTFPGESLTRIGLPLREAMRTPHGAVLGLSNDSLGYFVPSDEWRTGRNGNYEETVSLGEGVGDATRERILSLMREDTALDTGGDE